VSHNSGEQEWNTPVKYIEMAKIRLAQQGASNEGNTRHATARRATAAKALTLADRLVAIGGGQWVMRTELDTNWDLLFTAVTAAVFAGILIGLAVAILVIRTERNWARKRKALRGPKKPDKPWAMQWYFCL
jgi:hypothetical protein